MTAVRPTSKPAIDSSAISPARWLTHIAFVLALAVVIARLTTPDALREPWEASPGGSPRGLEPGPATALMFDLLAAIPALLVLFRRVVDRDYRLHFRVSPLLLLGLAVWAVLSTGWSADRFAAAVVSCHFFAAACLLWAMSQLVRSADRFRIVSALCFGLLLVLVTQTVMYKFVEGPETARFFKDNQASFQREQGTDPNSLKAKMMEHKVLSGEVISFFKSPNSLAAVGVLLFFGCCGLGVQKIVDGEPREWLLLSAIAAGSLVWILLMARSKTSAATPFIGLAILAVFAVARGRIRTHFRLAYLAGVGLVVFAMIAVIGHGLYHHGLFPGHFSNSLDFRWKYWVASGRMFTDHPWIGVGWDNFGLHYLAHRLPEAAEEISDPHNLLVRFFTELGAVGGILCIAWLLRLAWELTVPAAAIDGEAPAENSPGIRSIVAIILLGMLLHLTANMDFSQPLLDLLALMMKPILYLLALLLGTLGAAMLSPHTWSLDTRPAPWVVYCAITGLGMFLLHNLIDFSLFEAGAMSVFMMLAGASLGLAPAPDRRRTHRGFAVGAAFTAVTVWLAAASFFVAPVFAAEQWLTAGNESIRTAPADDRDGYIRHFREAATDFANASGLVPFNADYVFEQARTTAAIGDFAAAHNLLANAERLNPLRIDAYRLDAQLELESPHPNVAAVRTDFDTVIRLNPNDVSLHEQYAEALDHFGLHEQARVQYQAALDADDALPIGEPKRLSPDEVEQLKNKAQNPQMQK
jgi:O-antigen ligase